MHATAPTPARQPTAWVVAITSMLFVTACNRQDDEPVSTVRVFTYAGSTQCGRDPGMSLADMGAPLKDAGVRVLRAVCATDGRLIAARCGAKDGRIGIFEIPVRDLKKASSLNYEQIGALPDASEVECR